MERRPEGYLGINHTTIGSDLLAVLHALKLPENILGKAEYDKLSAVDPAKWYPIAYMIDLLNAVDIRVGHYGLLSVGRTVFRNSHEAAARSSFSNVKQLLNAFDNMYHNANHGTRIGGWQVLKFSEGHAELKKTTPHHCSMEQGLIHAALQMLDVRASILQHTCFRRGDDFCIYSISTAATGLRWSG